jgi:hypothetical protein
VGANLKWRFTVKHQASALFYDGSAYGVPAVDAVTVVNGTTLETRGGDIVQITGRNFGGAFTTGYFDATMSDVKLIVTYGGQDSGDRFRAVACSTLDHDFIECTSVPGRSHTHHFRVTIVDQINYVYWNSRTDRRAHIPFLDYTRPIIEAITGPGAHYAATNGGQLMEISGTNFGPVGALVGSVVHGIPFFQNPLLQTGGLTAMGKRVPITTSTWTSVKSETSGSLKYCDATDRAKPCDAWYDSNMTDASVLDQCECCVGWTTGDAKCDTCLDIFEVGTGKPLLGCDERHMQLFDVDSDYRGMVDVTRTSLLPRPNGLGSQSVDCYVTVADTQIRCFSGEGTGRDHWWILEIEDLYTQPTFGNTSYAVPVIEDLTGPGVESDTAGNQLVYITGRDFGSVERNLITDVIYGKLNSDLWFTAKGCKVTQDHHVIECMTAPGAGKDLQWRVEVDSQISILQSTNYAPPVILEILQADKVDMGLDFPDPRAVRGLRTEGNERITLVGRNFGPDDMTDILLLKVTYGPTGSEYECSDPQATTHQTVECTTAPGVGGKLAWKIYVHDQNSTVTSWTTQYNMPELKKLVYPIDATAAGALESVRAAGGTAEISTSGTETIRIWGHDFGVSATLARKAVIKIWFDGQDYSPDVDANGVMQMNSVKLGGADYDYLDFTPPSGQGKTKSLFVTVDNWSPNKPFEDATPSKATMRSTLAEIMHYRDPYIRGVNIFEGKQSKRHLTLFVSGDSFGVDTSLGNVRVAQTKSDFIEIDEAPYWKRIGGTRQQIRDACRFHKVGIAGSRQTDGTVMAKHCVHEDEGKCIRWGLEAPLPEWVFEGDGVPAAGLEVDAELMNEWTCEGDESKTTKEECDAAAAGDSKITWKRKSCPGCEGMCEASRAGKHSCLWDQDAFACSPDWGVNQYVVDNSTHSDWTHKTNEFQYTGNYDIDPYCTVTKTQTCEYLQGWVEVDVAELPATPCPEGTVCTTSTGTAPLLVSNLMYFVHYSPQIWSIGATVRPVGGHGYQEQLLETNVVSDNFNDTNITVLPYYSFMCGADPTTDMFGLPARVDFNAGAAAPNPKIAQDGPMELWNGWCGPCVGARKCLLVNKHVAAHTAAAGDAVASAALKQVALPYERAKYTDKEYVGCVKDNEVVECLDPQTALPVPCGGESGTTLAGCQQECSTRPECVSFVHNEITGECDLSSNCYTEDQDVVGWEIDFKPKPKVEGDGLSMFFKRGPNVEIAADRRIMGETFVNGSYADTTMVAWSKDAGVCGRDDSCLGRSKKAKSLLWYPTIGGSKVVLYGRYISGKASQVSVYIGAQGAVEANRNKAVVTGAARLNNRHKAFSVEFLMPVGQGMDNEVYVFRGTQPSAPVYVSYRPPVIERTVVKDCIAGSISGWKGADTDPITGAVNEGPALGDCRARVTTCKAEPDTTECVTARGCDQDAYRIDTSYVAPRRCDTSLTCSQDEDGNKCADQEREGDWIAEDAESAKTSLLVSTLGGTIVIYGKDLGVGGNLGADNKIVSVTGSFTTTDASKCTWVQYPIEHDPRGERRQPSKQSLDDGDQFCEKDVQCTRNGKLVSNRELQGTTDLDNACFCRTKMECVLPPGQGKHHEFQIEIGGQPSNSWFFSYAKPAVESTDKGFDQATAVRTDARVARGNETKESLTITGRNFGLDEDHITAQVKSVLANRILEDVPKNIFKVDEPQTQTIGVHIVIGPHVCRVTDHTSERLLCRTPETAGPQQDTERETECLGHDHDHAIGEEETFPCGVGAHAHRSSPWFCKDGSNTCEAKDLVRGACEYIPAKFVCDVPEGQGWRSVVLSVQGQNDTDTDFLYQTPNVTSYTLSSGHAYGRTDGLVEEGGEVDILTIEGDNLGRDGFQRDGRWEQYGEPRLVFDNNGAFSVNTDRFDTKFIFHNHSKITLELPRAKGGDKFPMFDLDIRVRHTDMRYRHPDQTDLEFGWNHEGLVRINGTKEEALFADDVSSVQFNYQIPTYKSISNLHYNKDEFWKRVDGGITDGYYAVLHGANFGTGCATKTNPAGDCTATGTFVSAKDKEATYNGARFDFKKPDQLGTIRYMSLAYSVDANGDDQKQYKIKELSGRDAAEAAVAGHFMKNEEELIPILETASLPVHKNVRTRLCTCAQFHGPEGESGDGCDQFDADAYCPVIKNWNHTHIVFWVDSGVGHQLPLQVETGGQRACEFKPAGNLNTPVELQWCEPGRDGTSCADDTPDHKQFLEIDPQTGQNYQEYACAQLEIIDPVTGQRKNKLDPDNIDRRECFCLTQYGQPAVTESGNHAVSHYDKHDNKTITHKYFDTFTDPNLWTWVPSNDVIETGQVTINYDLPVITKITPDVLKGHNEMSKVEFDQKTDAEKAELIDPVTGNLLQNAIGFAGEEISVTGENMGSFANTPKIDIDEMECTEAVLNPSADFPPLHPLPDKVLNCKAPLALVGPKGYDPALDTKTKMRLNLLVGGQYAIINPRLEPVTKLNLLATLCRRGFYGARFEKCVACPAAPTRDGQKPGAECVGGVGPGTEPISALGWFSTPLIKDDITWRGNWTRRAENSHFNTVLSRFDDDKLTEKYTTDAEKTEMIDVELNKNARRHLNEYTAFCNSTNKPNASICTDPSADPSTCVPESKYPPSAFWLGKDYRSCIHWYEPDHPKVIHGGANDGKPVAEPCEGKGIDCCLSRWCAMPDPQFPQKEGWSFVTKRFVDPAWPEPQKAAQRITKAGERRLSFAEQRRQLAEDSGAEEAEGCIVPLVYGDPRFYISKEDTNAQGDKLGNCRSNTHGWYVWEEDRVSTGRIPKRVKEQELLDCNITTWSEPPYRLGLLPTRFEQQIMEKVPPGGIATAETYCLAAVNKRVSNGKAPKKSTVNKARDAVENLEARLRRALGVADEDAQATPAPASGDAAISGSESGESGNVGDDTGADNRCHIDRWDRSTCPYVVPCEPAEACAGDNVCAYGYTGMKCSKCMEGFSRTDGVCVECAGNPIIMILFVALGGLVAAIAYYVVVVFLKINIGVISIGIDYFQIIGLFSSQKIPWPQAMKALFAYLQVFSFDMNMLGLECGGLQPHEMWFLIMLVPLGVIAVMIAGISLDILRLYLTKAKDKAEDLTGVKHKGHDAGVHAIMHLVESRIGLCMTVFLTVFYLMYVQLTKKTMDIFNCAAADPPDDPNNPTTYMTIAPDQECWRPGTWETGTHIKMMPWALVFVVCYSLAFPLFIYFKFQRNKLKIFEDQLLAAQDRGDKPATNVNFSFRKRYASLYKNFKPQFWYWSIVVLAKKLAVCFTGLMFRRNPSFQLAVALIVLFTCFTSQVLCRPFMSMDERADIVRLASRRDFEKGHRMLRKMAAFGNGGEVERAKKRLAMEEQAQLTIARALTLSSKYFVNYNKVETIFLGCAIYVCLAGVMFSSGYFDNPYFDSQRDALGYGTLGIVLVSTGFYFYVIGLEVTGVRKYRRHKNKAKWTAFKKKAHFHKDLFNLNNSNATAEEKDAASVIEACMKGRLARQQLHDRIMNDGTEEEKAILGRLEARVEARRAKRRAARAKKEAKKTGLSLFGGGGKSAAAAAKPKKTKSKKLKKRKTKKKGDKLKKKLATGAKIASEEATLTGVFPSGEHKEARSKGQELASWGD